MAPNCWGCWISYWSNQTIFKRNGKKELLSRIEEVKLAKRIEEGIQMMMRAISACPMSIEQILLATEEVKNETMKIEDFGWWFCWYYRRP